MPYCLRVLLENLIRHYDGQLVREEDVMALVEWGRRSTNDAREIPFMPSRVILQDFTGVPVIVDLASMRGAVKRMGGDPSRINPTIPVHLVVDHSVQVDFFGSSQALRLNLEKEFERNAERYTLLKWAQNAFKNFYVVPPGKGIIHQVNLEYLAKVVVVRETEGGKVAYPDSVLGTDSHTPMINALGILGWGVGGIEAEAVILGQPYYMTVPEVVGFRLTGELREGVTATDLVLTVTEMLRRKGVVGKFVEFFGDALRNLSVPDRATISNMAPEYGATIGFFPIDQATLNYLRMTGREESHVKLVEIYAREQGLFLEDSDTEIRYSDVIELDLSDVEPSIAGPTNPEERIPLKDAKRVITSIVKRSVAPRAAQSSSNAQYEGYPMGEGGSSESLKGTSVKVRLDGEEVDISHGAVTIAAITSCTNTSNPSVMLGAGLLARKAVEAGLRRRPYVKTSMAPGSAVVTEYLRRADLLRYLEELGFHVVGYGCTTCIGNSGPLQAPVAKAITDHKLYTVAVLSGNRNFEGRIHPLVSGSFLMSPMLVVVYSIAGSIDVDLTSEPLGKGSDGRDVYLRDIWPSLREVRELIESTLSPEDFIAKYSDIFKGDERWESLNAPTSPVYKWDEASNYVKEPPFFRDLTLDLKEPDDIRGARVLALLGDRITTDHISPAGSIPVNSPAGRYLTERGVRPHEFDTYGARRGNHEVMIRGTFANIRLRNMLTPDMEGGWTVHFPSNETMTIYDAAMRYQSENVPLMVLAGKQYGAGSSRDWAAKGVYLLGVRAVIAESFERIHRSNLVGMGVLPLEFKRGESWKGLGLKGNELYSIEGIGGTLRPMKELRVRAVSPNGDETVFTVTARLDTPMEVEYYRHGGIMRYVLRKILRG